IVGRGPTGDEFEHRIRPERIVVVLTLVAAEDAKQPAAEHLVNRVVDPVRIAGVVQNTRERRRKADPLVKLDDRRQAAVAGKLRLRRFDDHRQAAQKIEAQLPSTLYTHFEALFTLYVEN